MVSAMINPEEIAFILVLMCIDSVGMMCIVVVDGIKIGGKPTVSLTLPFATHNSSNQYVSLPTFTPLLRTCRTIIDSDKDNS